MIIGLGIGIPFIHNYAYSTFQPFDPSTLFANGEPGAWYDPSDLTTLFQDAAGTTPVTAVEQPVGLMLDKSRGLVLGPELVTNGDFSAGTTGWSSSSQFTSAATVVSGEFQVTASIGSGRQIYAITCVVGRAYLVVGTCRFISGTGSAFIGIGNTDAGISIYTATSNSTSTPVQTRGQFIATSTTMYVAAGSTGGTGVTAFDNISVRELPGNHAFQTTATSRPILSSKYNLWTNTETLATQNRTVRAAKHIISFSGTGTVALSGAFSGSLVGTGVNDRVYLEFTTTAGTLTATVSGSVTKAQLEEV